MGQQGLGFSGGGCPKVQSRLLVVLGHASVMLAWHPPQRCKQQQC